MDLESCTKCEALSVRLGLCAKHYGEWIDDVYKKRVLPRYGATPPPPCWDGDERAWIEYQALAAVSSKFRSHCTDCTPEFKAKQLAAGKCNRPETIFVERELEAREPEVVGLNRDFLVAYYRAVTGREGRIIESVSPKLIYETLIDYRAALKAQAQKSARQKKAEQTNTTDDRQTDNGEGYACSEAAAEASRDIRGNSAQTRPLPEAAQNFHGGHRRSSDRADDRSA